MVALTLAVFKARLGKVLDNVVSWFRKRKVEVGKWPSTLGWRLGLDGL